MSGEFLTTQMDYVFFVYGLAFLLLAAICITIRHDDPRGLPWATLGLFGLCHGVCEWLEMLALPMGDNRLFAGLRLGLLALSFGVLLEFARVGWRRMHGFSPGRWIHIPLLLGALTGAAAGSSGLNATIRYVLGLPSATWAALTLLRAARAEKAQGIGMVLGAATLIGYALTVGVIVPPARFFPASAFNARVFLDCTGIPVQAVRAILAVLISASLWAHHLRYRRGVLDAEERPGSYHGWQMAFALVVVLAAGWAVTQAVGGHADQDLRESIEDHAEAAAAVVDTEAVKAVAGAPAAALPAFRQLSRQFQQMLDASPQFRRVHLLVLKPPREVVSVLSVSDVRHGLAPGRPAHYPQPPQALLDAFTANPAAFAYPHADEEGAFISGFAPVRDLATGRVVAVLALDLDAGHWRKDVAEFRLMAIAVTLLISVLLLGFFVVRQRSWQAAEQIAVNESRLAEAQEVAHLGSWTYNPRSGRMTWSQELFRILGCQPVAAEATQAAIQQRLAREDRPRVDAAFQAAQRDGDGRGLEVRCVLPDSSVRHLIWRVRPKRGSHGAVVSLVGTIQDITERKQAEEALRQERNLLRTLIDQLPDFIYVKDAAGRFLVANKAVARLMGAASPDDLIGKTDAGFYPPELAARYRADEQRILRSGEPLINKDEPHTDPAGTPRAVLTTKIPMRDPHGQIVGVVGISRDITDRKQAEEEIKRLNATLEQRVRERTSELTDAYAQLESFSYSISHDLRAPLRHIIGFLDLYRKTLPAGLDPQATDCLENIGAASTRMAALIDDLLAFSRIGRAEMHTDRVDLQRLVQEVLHDLEPDTAGRRIAWKIGPLPEVAGDAAMLRQVLANLLDNALKFSRTREQAEIEVGSCLEPDRCTVFVRDNGVGFDPAYADKLFGVFQRLHPQAQFTGTGVGLATVRRIVQRHGGRTWAESAPGQGATFFFTLPRT